MIDIGVQSGIRGEVNDQPRYPAPIIDDYDVPRFQRHVGQVRDAKKHLRLARHRSIVANAFETFDWDSDAASWAPAASGTMQQAPTITTGRNFFTPPSLAVTVRWG